MGFVSKLGDIILMENDEKLLVIDCVEYQNESYLKVGCVVDKNSEKKMVEGYVKETILENGTYSLTIVNNEKLKNTLENLRLKIRNEANATNSNI